MLNRFSPPSAFVLFLGAAQASVAAPGELHGRIADSITQRPISGAVVRVLQGSAIAATGQSDAEGRFIFGEVGEGIYTVEVAAPGHLKAAQAGVRVVLNKAAAVDFLLVRVDAPWRRWSWLRAR